MRAGRCCFVLLTAFIAAANAYGQSKPGNSQVNTISGTVVQSDFVGDTITVLTNMNQQMTFSVPGNAIIVREAKDIELMDIKVGSPVIVKYDISSPGKDIAVSIIDNKPVSNG